MLKAALTHTQEGVRAMQSVIQSRAAEVAAAPALAVADAASEPAASGPTLPPAEPSFLHHTGSFRDAPGAVSFWCAGVGLSCK